MDLKQKVELRLKFWQEKLERAQTQVELRQAQAVLAELRHLLEDA